LNFDFDELIYVIKGSILTISFMTFSKKRNRRNYFQIAVAVFKCNLCCAIK